MTGLYGGNFGPDVFNFSNTTKTAVTGLQNQIILPFSTVNIPVGK